MNQQCYNSIALARHQHNLDRQEAKEHLIAAAVDRLMDDENFIIKVSRDFEIDSYGPSDFGEYARHMALFQANREYQQHLSALEQARIDAQEGL